MRPRFVVACLALLLSAFLVIRADPCRAANRSDKGGVTGIVTDSSGAQPLQAVDVTVRRDGRLVAAVVTDQFGRFVVRNLAPGAYTVQAQVLGYAGKSRQVTVGAGGPTVVAFQLSTMPVDVGAITVQASAPVAVNTRTGDQVFKQKDYHAAPSQTTSQILQQSMAGAVRAPTGEVHIRGQHAEYTYYVDGVPVPSGISGSLNELFDPEVVNRIDFQTGGWDAEYGGKNAAVINVLTKIPSGRFHANASGYGGNLGANGQSLNLSSNAGNWGWFLSGTRTATDMRENPVLFDTTTLEPINFHNYGEDLYGFGKVQYVGTTRNTVTLDLNWSRTRFQVPFDSVGGALNNDNQTDVNGFVNLAWHHRFGSSAGESSGSELFTGLFLRHGSLSYVPGATDVPSFIFFPDTTPYNLSEDRSFDTYGLKADYLWRVRDGLELKLGTMSSVTAGHERFITTDAGGQHGPQSVSSLHGSDFGSYVQTVYRPVERWEVRAGVRYDAHTAPFAGAQTQVSPRLRLSYLPDPQNTFFVYYGRLFMPTNVEDLRAITSVADSGVVAEPTLPERDDFFSAGIIHRFPFGLVAKLDGYYKHSTPGIDDNTVPGSAIVTSVNLAEIRVTGIETVLDWHPAGPLSGYLNFSLNHAYGRGPVTGGFFPTDVADVPGRWFDLDHDQRASAVGNVVYSPSRWFFSATAIYGSGLPNGAEQTAPIATGIFDFNSAYHVKPNFVLNASAGYSFVVAGKVARPQLYVDNVLDNHYLLKGAFFSGAAVGRPRTVELRVAVGM